jgi:integrase
MAGGLRVGEVTALKWRDIDLASGVPRVTASKTEAGVRLVALDANLREELTEHKARARDATPDGYVFPGRDGKRRDRNAVRRSVLYPAIKRTNVTLRERNLPAIPDGSDGQPRMTFHSLRRTYASLCAEAGIDHAWTSRQIGHKRSSFTIDVYTDVDHRRNDPAERAGALVWADKGSLPLSEAPSADSLEKDSALESA